jgi:Restriction endonuclease EcoRII, N-terminal
MNSRSSTIEKVLSRNDTGETGGHQAGVLIPKNGEILSFFPELGISLKNPRHLITFHDHLGEQWSFSFIYYNNKFFGGTRNEYRLTGMTRYINAYNLKSCDILTLSRDAEGFYYVKYKKDGAPKGDGPIKLSNSWRVVKI